MALRITINVGPTGEQEKKMRLTLPTKSTLTEFIQQIKYQKKKLENLEEKKHRARMRLARENEIKSSEDDANDALSEVEEEIGTNNTVTRMAFRITIHVVGHTGDQERKIRDECDDEEVVLSENESIKNELMNESIKNELIKNYLMNKNEEEVVGMRIKVFDESWNSWPELMHEKVDVINGIEFDEEDSLARQLIEWELELDVVLGEVAFIEECRKKERKKREAIQHTISRNNNDEMNEDEEGEMMNMMDNKQQMNEVSDIYEKVWIRCNEYQDRRGE
eukprot:533885_1